MNCFFKAIGDDEREHEGKGANGYAKKADFDHEWNVFVFSFKAKVFPSKIWWKADHRYSFENKYVI